MATDIETLAGVFHPHAIEVQDFSDYGLILDVRSPSEYADDHIPGAVQYSPSVIGAGPWASGPGDEGMRPMAAKDSAGADRLPDWLEERVSALKLSQAILVYCGRGGLDSLPVARALRWRGWSVDVLPGGWINYRRWVQAGLEVLPRMLSYRIISMSLSTETERALRALETMGHQVLNLGALMGIRRGALTECGTPGLSQARLESRLLQRLRAMDPRKPVWVGDADAQSGEVRVPGSMADAMGTAPRVVLQAPLDERVRCWLDDEPAWRSSSQDVIEWLASGASPPDSKLIKRWRELKDQGLPQLASSMLRDYFDQLGAETTATGVTRARNVAILFADALRPEVLALAFREQSRYWIAHSQG